MPSTHALFATCPKGIEPLLAEELRALGAPDVRETRAGVAFAGDTATSYRACLWSRLASRVLLPLAQFKAPSADALYQGVRTIRWSEHLGPESTLAVDCTAVQSPITHSHFAALKVKDAIVDQLRDELGARPSIDTDRPDVRVNVYLNHHDAIVSIDLSGDALHRRGYRADGMEAPMKENLAAAILMRAGWPATAQTGGTLIDPMCGSGTLLIEGALMAADAAPGLLRNYFGFLKHRGYDERVWQQLLTEARARRAAGLERLAPIRGYDRDPRAIRAARENIKRAGLAQHIVVEQRELSACIPAAAAAGLVVANPPYGERMGEAHDLPVLYAELGDALKRCFPGWRAAVLAGNPELGKNMGIRAHRMHTLYNGALECKLLHFAVDEKWFMRAPRAESAPVEIGAGGEMFGNRLRKDLKHFGRWAARQEIGAYRLYDADMHEYNVAIDVYQGARRWAHVQEYEAPATIEPRLARRRLREALAVIPIVLEIPAEQMYFKVRRRQKGHAQYQKLGAAGEFHEVREGAYRFLVNFTDYLDTGLFLDHRPTRALLGKLARGRRFLNLFGYTGSATVYAGSGGARSTTTVDLSRTYLDWARRNLELNGLRSGEHELIQADVLQWLAENSQRRYGLIFLDPPTFSRSKRMDETFDVQRDYIDLIQQVTRLLEPDGTLIFSTNNRRFRMDADALADLHIEDITRQTIPKDFERNPRIHQCFRITAR